MARKPCRCCCALGTCIRQNQTPTRQLGRDSPIALWQTPDRTSSSGWSLTKAQGMPKNIEAALTKMICNFIWGEDKQPHLAMEILQKPLEEGGLSLLDVKAQNEAIEIGWLKTYLNFSPTRPTWATVTDLTIAAVAPPGLSPLAIVNCFLQNWPPPTRGPRATKLGHDIARMLKTAKKYGTSLAAIRLSPSLRAKLLAWYHLESKPRPLTNRESKCLLRKHKVKSV
ncbi:hypothetical protein EDB87DRAFT_1571750, partial [Lactarius vividus]